MYVCFQNVLFTCLMNFLQNQKCQEVEEMEVDKEPTAVIKGKFVKLLTYLKHQEITKTIETLICK